MASSAPDRPSTSASAQRQAEPAVDGSPAHGGSLPQPKLSDWMFCLAGLGFAGVLRARRHARSSDGLSRMFFHGDIDVDLVTGVDQRVGQVGRYLERAACAPLAPVTPFRRLASPADRRFQSARCL